MNNAAITKKKNLFTSEGGSTPGEGFQKEHLYWILNDEKAISVQR